MIIFSLGVKVKVLPREKRRLMDDGCILRTVYPTGANGLGTPPIFVVNSVVPEV